VYTVYCGRSAASRLRTLLCRPQEQASEIGGIGGFGGKQALITGYRVGPVRRGLFCGVGTVGFKQKSFG